VSGTPPGGGDKRATAVAALLACGLSNAADLLRDAGLDLPAECVPVDKSTAAAEQSRAETIREMQDLEKQLQKRRLDAERYGTVIANAQKELLVAQKAMCHLETRLGQLTARVGPAAADMEITLGNEQQDLKPVLKDVHHITQLLGNTEHLDQAYHAYADKHETPLQPAAWIAMELRSHLTGLERPYESMCSNGDDYQLVKKRRTDEL
jgi:chromosome segregation ATPase